MQHMYHLRSQSSSSRSLINICISLSFLHLPPLISIYIESRSKLHSAVPMTMFIHKLLHPCRLVPSIFLRPPADPALSDDRAPPGDRLAMLKIVHARGMVESYYMALPAANFISRYPSVVLARPEVFRRPWYSVVRLEEILVSREKYYVVPRRTVEKLWRRPAESSS